VGAHEFPRGARSHADILDEIAYAVEWQLDDLGDRQAEREVAEMERWEDLDSWLWLWMTEDGE